MAGAPVMKQRAQANLLLVKHDGGLMCSGIQEKVKRQ
jgi:hypothetical protein